MAPPSLRPGAHPSAELLELVPDIVYEFRLVPHPGFVYVSPSVTTVTGYTPDEHYADPELGRRIAHPDDLGRLASMMTDPDEQQVYVIRWRTKAGGQITTAQRLRLVRDEHGAVVSLVGVCRPLAAGEPDWRLRFGDLQLDLVSNQATIAGRTVSLTPSEQQILAVLASADRTVPRRELVERLWGAYQHSGERTVEVHVSNLRKKLEADARRPLRVVTVRGVGYRLVRVTGLLGAV